MNESTNTPQPDDDLEKVRHDAEVKIQQIEEVQERAESSAVTGQGKLLLLAVVVMLAAGWHRTFMEMWLRWFPAWHTNGLSLMDRFTQGDSYYTHGPLVPLTSLIIVWLVHKRVGVPVRRSRSASWLGGLMLAVFLIFHLLSVSPSARVMFVSGFSLIGVIGGLVLLWGGWPLARAYWLPVALLFFMVPIPEVWIGDLNFRLKFLAGRTALWFTTHLFGVPAVMDGSYVYLPPDALGNPKILVIDNVCSGLRSLISLIWFAALFAMVCRTKGLWRLFMLAMAGPIAVVSNIVRITSLNLAAHYGSIEIAGPHGWFHDLSGLLVFAMALGLLFGLEQTIIIMNRVFRRDWIDHRLLGYLDAITPADIARHSRPQVGPMVALGLVAMLSVYWSAYTWDGDVSNPIEEVVPESIQFDGATFIGEDHKLDQLSLIILEYPDYVYRRYTNPNTGDLVDLLIVFSANNRKGTHPPEVCIEGSGDKIIGKSIQPLTVPGIGEVSMRELLTQRANRQTCFLYVYKCGDKYTPSFFAQQFWIFVNGITGQNTAGALIRMSVSARTQDMEPAQKLARAAASALMPYIDKKLP